jgi:hypothetical protein
MTRRIDSGFRKTHGEKQSAVTPNEGICGLLKNGGNAMSIKTIPRSEFDRLVPQNPVLESWMVEQVEWFSDTSGKLLAAIAKGKGVAAWNYVILERDQKGVFQVRKVMSNFFSSEVARVDLWLCMAGSEKIARIDVLLSMVESEKSNCANQPNVPVLLTSPAPSEVVDGNYETTDIELAV